MAPFGLHLQTQVYLKCLLIVAPEISCGVLVTENNLFLNPLSNTMVLWLSHPVSNL